MIPSPIDARFDCISERPLPTVISYSPSHVRDPDRTHPAAFPREPQMSDSASPTTCLVADDHPAVVEAVADVLGDQRDRGRRSRTQRDRRSRADRGETSRAWRCSTSGMPRPLGNRDRAPDRPHRAGDRRHPLHRVRRPGTPDRGDERRPAPAASSLKEAPLAEVVPRGRARRGGHGPTSTRCLPGVLSSSMADRQDPQPHAAPNAAVLRLLADGLSNEEIGKELFISHETVRTHVRKAMAKLDADTRTQAVATALRQSLIS